MIVAICFVFAAVALHLYQQSRPLFIRKHQLDNSRIRSNSQQHGSTPRVLSCYTPIKSNGKGYTFNEAMRGLKR
jgi:hypothetical protein